MMNCEKLNHHASLPDLSGQKKNLCQQKHTKYVIFPIDFCEFPPVEMFFAMKFSVKNTASYI